ncbi:hypothetical protein C4D60_Mb08t12550 [Musa balbisiana]|uniref:Uncharacterized protein n=1 Tax=Musa balbisiana TaxID=52838 RepID=A0A4S8K3B2_MUSBA|nr:hypothetical protein C4D60_Mb08t12550 [Musa balbisiana]
MSVSSGRTDKVAIEMSFVLVFTFGLVIILSKTGVEGRRLEENPLDSSLRGVQGKEYVHADNKVVFSSSSTGGSNDEEAKKDINSIPGEKKVKAAADASVGYSFGVTKDAENVLIVFALVYKEVLLVASQVKYRYGGVMSKLANNVDSIGVEVDISYH